MFRLSCMAAGDDALLQLSDAPRHALAGVLADWLNVYAGIDSRVIRREYFDTVVELRRVLLAKDEWLASPSPARVFNSSVDGDHDALDLISLVATHTPSVEHPDGLESVSVTFEGLPESGGATPASRRIKVTLAAAEAAMLCQRLSEHVATREA